MTYNIKKIKAWYSIYYLSKGIDRNNIRINLGVLFQTLASEKSFIKAIRKMEKDPKELKVLDVGCGNGLNNYQLLRLDFLMNNIYGIDINEERITTAQSNFPNAKYLLGDALNMQFKENTFDVIYESTLFATLSDDFEFKTIASEMLRVCKCGGYLLLVDWRIRKPFNNNYNALTKNKLTHFFNIGKQTKLITIEKGSIIPPLGRFLSKYFSAIYFLVALCFPFLVGQVTYLLQKINPILEIKK